MALTPPTKGTPFGQKRSSRQERSGLREATVNSTGLEEGLLGFTNEVSAIEDTNAISRLRVVSGRGDIRCVPCRGWSGDGQCRIDELFSSCPTSKISAALLDLLSMRLGAATVNMFPSHSATRPR